jgi:hypothetical protein
VADGPGAINYSKAGKTDAQSILGLIATGDASIKTAANNGTIKTIQHVDSHAGSILGLIGKDTTTVYGD